MIKVERRADGKKAYCPAGHKFTSDNTYVFGKVISCKMCMKERTRFDSKERYWDKQALAMIEGKTSGLKVGISKFNLPLGVKKYRKKAR